MTTEQRTSLMAALALCPDGSCIAGLKVPAALQGAWNAATPAVKVSMIESLQADPTGANWQSKTSAASTAVAVVGTAVGAAAGLSPYLALANLGLTIVQAAMPALTKMLSGQEVSREEQAAVAEAMRRIRTAAAYEGEEWVPSGK